MFSRFVLHRTAKRMPFSMRLNSSWWVYIAAAAVGVAGAAPFVDASGRLVFDADLWIPEILTYHAFFSSWSWDLFTPPVPNVYFEGQSFIYGLALHLYQAVAGVFGAAPPLRAAAIGTVGLVGAAAHIGATVMFCATARLLLRNDIAALALTLLFGLSPQILDIDLIRIDRLMIFPLMVVMHVSVLITRREARGIHGAALGAAMALLAATKISGVLFAGLPVLAAFIVLALDKAAAGPRLRAVFLTAFAVGAPVLLVLMIRHLIHTDLFFASVAHGYAAQMKWTSVLPFTPLFYYNVDLFAGYGAVFLGLVALAALLVAVRAVVDRDATSLWLIMCLVAFSAAGMAVFKYERGGYHLVPLYLFTLAIGVRTAMDIFGARMHHRRAVGELATAAAVLLLPIIALAQTYAAQTVAAGQREASVIHTRFDSRDWILARFAPGERICMMASSQWANPPLGGHGLQVTTAPFDFPYLDGTAMADYMAPSLHQVRAACDGVVLNDGHSAVYLNNFNTRGYPERRAEWDRLFAGLRAAYRPQIFQGQTKAYFVERVEVFDLRGAPANGEPALPSRARVLAGSFDGEAFTFAGARVPIVANRFAGAIDTAARLDDGRLGAEGWAVDTDVQKPAPGIVLVAGDKIIGFGGTGTIRRGDVASARDTPDDQLAGFGVCGPGDPASGLRVFALSLDGTAGELPPPAGATSHARVPYPCVSYEGP